MQSVQFDLLVFEFALGFIRPGQPLLFLVGDLFQRHFRAWKTFFLDARPLRKILRLISLMLELLYFSYEMPVRVLQLSQL